MRLRDYLAEIKKIQLLQPAEEQALWQAYKENGDLEARRLLIEHYQPLVFKIAMRWQADEALAMDLIQEGTVGLIEAAEHYDPERGAAFSLYAQHRIRGRMLNYLAREGKPGWLYLDNPEQSGLDAGAFDALLVDQSADVPGQAEHNFLVTEVKNAMSRLPLKEQIAVSGAYLEEQEPKQLAATMEISLSHLYRLQKQGIQRLRGMLSRLMQEMKKQ